MATIKINPDNAVVSGINRDGTQFRKIYSRKRFGNGFKKIAQEKYEELLFDNSRCANGGQSIKEKNLNRMTVGELATKYVEEHLAFTHASKNAKYIDMIVSRWGDWKLHLITPAVVRPWLWAYLDGTILKKNGEKYSAASAKLVLAYFRRIFNWGCESDIIENNPLRYISDRSLRKEFARRIKPRQNPIPFDHFKEIVDLGYLWFQRVCWHAWYTGMRRGEIVQLKWSMIDGNLIYLKADETKEADSKIVPMEPCLIDQIEAVRLEQSFEGTYNDNGYIYLGSTGKPIDAETVTSMWRWFRKKAGYPQYNFHDIRSTWENRKESEGYSLRAISAALGHHSSNTTIHHYRSVSKDEILSLIEPPPK